MEKSDIMLFSSMDSIFWNLLLERYSWRHILEEAFGNKHNEEKIDSGINLDGAC